MNKSHRIVWSESRQTFVVTHEKSAARGKPSSVRTSIATAVATALVSLAGIGTGDAIAQTSYTVSVTDSVSFSLSTGDQLHVTPAGQIIASGSAVSVAGHTANVIANAGTISGTSNGVSITANASLTGGLTNAGLIQGVAHDGLYVNGVLTNIVGGITNSGTITGGTLGLVVDGQSSVTGVITNSGSIGGSHHGIFISTGTVTGGITNSGSGNITGTNNSGVHVNNSSLSGNLYNAGTVSGATNGIAILGNTTVTGGVNNAGLISATGATANGLLIDHSHLGSGITNTGNITASGTSGLALYVNYSALGGGITNSGTIVASGTSGLALYVANSTLGGGITNSGTISSFNSIGLGILNSTVTGDVTNAIGGTITGNSGIYIYRSSLSGSVINAGAITAQGSGVYIGNSTLNGSVINAGAITAQGNGVYISNSTLNGGVTNTGTISAAGNYGVGLSQSMVAGNITNSGTIAGGSAGLYLYHSTVGGGITNSGTIVANAGYEGVYIRSSSSVSGAVTNTNLIRGHDGLFVENSTLSGGINNTGTIIGSSATGVAFSHSTVTGGITNSGTIQGARNAIDVDGLSSVSGITIAGNNTAVFIGAVVAPNTPVQVASGATYTMNNGQQFTVSGFTNAGTLKIGAGNTGTITGNFTNTGTFSPQVSSATSYGKLNVTGTANLGGTALIDAAQAVASTAGNTLVGLIHAGSLSGTFASVTSSNQLFAFTPVYDTVNGNFDLTVAAANVVNSNTGVLAATKAVGNTPAYGAAAALDTIIDASPTGPIASLFATHNITGNQTIANAVSQTLPLLVGGSDQAAGAAMTSINKIVQARIEHNLGLTGGDDFLGDKAFWVKPFGSSANQGDLNGVSGFQANTSGLALGSDSVVTPNTRVGLSFAYARAGVTGNSTVAPNSANIDVYQLTGYGSYGLDQHTDVNFQVGLGQNHNSGTRNLPSFGLVANSSYSSMVATAGAGVGRVFQLSEVNSFTPSVRADYTWVQDQSYSESGAGALDLNVQDRTTQQFILSVDGKYSHRFDNGLNLSGNLGLGYDTMNQGSSITAAYAGGAGAAFTTSGLNLEPWIVNAGLGLTGTTSSGMEVTVRYDVQSRQGFIDNAVSAKLRWTF